MENERRDLLTAAMAGAPGMMGAELAAPTAARAQGGPLQPRFIEHEPPRNYAKACVYGNLIFLSGEDSEGSQDARRCAAGPCEEQTELLFQNMQATLESVGSSLAHVIKMTAMLKDLRDQPGYS